MYRCTRITLKVSLELSLKFNVRVCIKPLKTIKDILFNAKDSVTLEKWNGAVYEIPCLDRPGVYISETDRCFATRLKEYRRDLKPRNLAKIDDDNINKKTALVKHVILNDHKIEWNDCKILCHEPDYSKRRFLESFYINQNVHAVCKW